MSRALAMLRLITLACAGVMAFSPKTADHYRAAILAWPGHNPQPTMSILENLVDAFLAMPRGASARAMFYLQTGVLEGNANPRMQAVLDRWVHQVERANLRMAILRGLEGPAKGRAEIERGTA